MVKRSDYYIIIGLFTNNIHKNVIIQFKNDWYAGQNFEFYNNRIIKNNQINITTNQTGELKLNRW